MEGDMQQEADHPGPQEEASAQGPCRLAVVEHMRMLADSHTAATRAMLLRGADEIERLYIIVQSYAASAQAAAAEINELRSQLKVSTGVTGNRWFTIPPAPSRKGEGDGDVDGEVAQLEDASSAARTNQGAAANAS
jgi:hypothetical protein